MCFLVPFLWALSWSAFLSKLRTKQMWYDLCKTKYMHQVFTAQRGRRRDEFNYVKGTTQCCTSAFGGQNFEKNSGETYIPDLISTFKSWVLYFSIINWRGKTFRSVSGLPTVKGCIWLWPARNLITKNFPYKAEGILKSHNQQLKFRAEMPILPSSA